MIVRQRRFIHLPNSIHWLASAFQRAGYELYVVGGAVRDAMMGREPDDFDLSTNATPQEVQNIVTQLSNWTADETGKAFGVIRAIYRPYNESNDSEEYHEYEIATFREDISAGRHPEVRFATIVEDVNRRDLTINALFYDISKEEIVDMVGGLNCIENHVISTVGDPEDRFREDPLRKMRALRFAARFAYMFDHKTERAILIDGSLQGVSAERIRDEFVRGIASEHYTGKFCNMISYFEMWSEVLPGLDVQSFPRTWLTSNVSIILSVLLENNDYELLEKKLNELKYSDIEVRQILFFWKFRDLFPGNAYKMRKHFFQSKLQVNDLNEYELQRRLPQGQMLRAFIEYLKLEPVSGDALLAEGYSGRALGVELERREKELFERLL